ncbi:MAG: hypothetical protein HGA67_00225 [Candidatus Yonathbacteria bacterium]|nr:hypothetical protein [Candidatus Yonathbacteria bacterium]
MAITNNLKLQVDLPVWEWCRFAPTATTAVSSLTTGNSLENKYLYYQVSGALYRYDTRADAWHQLSSVPANTPTIMNNSVLSNAVGHYGQAISGGTNTIQLAGLSGQILVGYKIRILSGTGAGQERTITAVSAPTFHERGMVTTASTTQLIDASTGVGLKQWKTNQWKNYQARIDFGTGKTQLRPILYNTQNTLTFSDVNYLTIDPWANCPLTVATVANASFFVIESHQVTVNTNWTVVPDESSRFVILSGGIWNVSQGTTAAPFFSLMYYDRLSDVWYQKSTQSGLKTAVFAAGDLSMERYTEAGGAIVSATAVASATARSITTATPMTAMQYANFEVRIVGGTGIGQSRTILSNTTTKLNFARDWDITPDTTSTYEVWRDVGKIMMIGGGDAGMLQYSQETDQWTTGKQLDNGQCNQLAVKKNGDNPIAITSITRTATGITSVNATPVAGGSGYNVNDLLTLATGTGGVVRVSAVSSTGAVTAVTLESVGTGYSVATFATTVSPTGGTGCTISVTAVDYTELALLPIAHNYKVGDSVTISGASGTGAAKFNGTYTIIGIPALTTNLSFSYCSVGDPGAPSATIPYSPSATQLVDCTKNWVPNEHVGKLVQTSSNAVLSVGQTRRIISNTPTTLTWTLAMTTVPANGTTKYVIEDIKPFGTDRMSKGEVTGTEGFATGGSTTTLVDTTKNWETNYWSRTVNRKVRIVEGTGVGSEIAITSNTATTLTFATQTFTPDTTTRYVIMDTFGTATAGTTTTLTDSSQNWEVNYWAGSRVRFLSGTSQGNEYTITSNTATALTFATGTAPDVSTAYAILEASPKTSGIHLDCINGSTDTSLNSNYLYAWTGTASAELSRYNVHTEHWDLLSYFPQTETLTSGAMYVYDGVDRIYYIQGATTLAKLMYYDLVKNIVVPASQPPYGMGAAIAGNRMEIIETDDGLKYLYLMRHSGTEMWRILLYF